MLKVAGSECPCEQLNSGNMADEARPAQQLLVSNTLGLIYPYLTPGGVTLKVTAPSSGTHLPPNSLTDTNLKLLFRGNLDANPKQNPISH